MIEKTLENLKKYKEILKAKVNTNASVEPVNALHHIEEAISAIEDIQEETTGVCEWIHYDYRTIVPKYHDADNPYWRIPEHMEKLKYCPYCSKEIKIVE